MREGDPDKCEASITADATVLATAFSKPFAVGGYISLISFCAAFSILRAVLLSDI
jgi:hypothetical protein